MSKIYVFDTLHAGMNSFLLQDKAVEGLLLRKRSAKPPRPAKPGDTNENEGLATLRASRKLAFRFLTR